MTVVITIGATMKKVILLVISSWLLISCQQEVVYNTILSLPTQGWAADSMMVFTPRIDDTLGNYQLQLLLRHNERYAYQNIWLFVEVRQDTLLLHSDTIECMLADERGVWYGKGMTRFTLPLLYKEDIAMPAGEYVVTVQQGMREETLQGITEVGLKVIENR